jgi:alpha-tubulin suppressor-like RCC1 family protein
MNIPMTTMNRLRLALGCVLALAASPLATAQVTSQMPQDNWRYNGLEFASPLGKGLGTIAIGAGGVYVSEQNTPQAIIQFTEGGVFVRRFAPTFTNVAGIACDSNGNVYVLDTGNPNSGTFQVTKYDQTGNYIWAWGGAGNGNGQFGVWSGGTNMIAVDKNNQIYVCDPGNQRMQVFDTGGNFLRAWGQPGTLPSQFNTGYPTFVASTPDGRIISNTGGFNVSFDSNGGYLNSGSSYYAAPAVISPDGMLGTYNYYGTLYFADASFQSITNSYVPGYPAAMSARGYYFGITADTINGNYTPVVRVWEREYSNVQNSLSPPAMPQPMILASSQRPGTTWMDIDYQVVDADSPTVTTGLLAFNNGGLTLNDAIVMSTFMEGTGANLGANQTTGVNHHVTWNMAPDWSVDFAQVQVEALAKDNRNLLGIHWITVPVTGTAPAVQVSAGPITDAKLLDLWFWFIATHNPGVSFANGTVTGTTGQYSGLVLAYSDPNVGGITTTAGRLFCYDQLGVSPINSVQIAQAQAGNYGFSSVDGNSVVNLTNLATTYVQSFGYFPDWPYYGSVNTVFKAAGTSGAVQLAPGSQTNTVTFIKADGSLWGMGQNNYGQLGDGTTTDRFSPVQIATGVTQVAAGDVHTLFVKSDGTLWACGFNNFGQLNDGTTTNRTSPVQVGNGVVQVAAGTQCSFFVKTDGTLWAVGYNGYGQLGDGTNINRTAPVQIATGVATVSAGAYHTMFVKTDGTLWAMGNNGNGQFGDGTTTSQNSPEQIPGVTGVASASAGSYHSLFVTTNGVLWAMGQNAFGEIGDGTTTQRNSPVQVATGVSLASAGNYFSLFTKADRSLWVMGQNNNGQLCDGTTTNHPTPLQVDVDATAISAAYYMSSVIFSHP